MTEEQAAWYLAGFIDGEGSMSKVVRGRRELSIPNTDEALIDAACRALDVLAIPYRTWFLDRPPHKRVFSISIATREGLEKVADLVPIQAPEKRRRLEYAVASYTYRKRPSAERLAELYATRSIASVAQELRIPATTAQAWLIKAGVKFRSLSEASDMAVATGARVQATPTRDAGGRFLGRSAL